MYIFSHLVKKLTTCICGWGSSSLLRCAELVVLWDVPEALEQHTCEPDPTVPQLELYMTKKLDVTLRLSN
jgi:hypothetical protein